MNKNIISCPSCKTEIELTELVGNQIRQQLSAELDARRKSLEAAIAQRETDLAQKAAALQKDRLALDASIQEKLQLERARLAAEARKQAETDLSLQLNDLREQLKQRGDKLAEAQKAQLEFLKREQALQQEKQELDLTLQKRLAEEREKLQVQARQFALEEHQLKLADKEKTIASLRNQIEALNLKASKTSQQLQGEVLEEQFETLLRQSFPQDEITPIKTGAHGADLLQVVRTTQGAICGRILWEVKRTASFQKAWLPKLKEDQREQGAEISVILSQTLPDGCDHFEQREGVWITAYHCGLGLAAALRQGLIQTAAARRAAEGKTEKMDLVYQYLSGTEFRHRVEALVENFIALRKDLEAEKRALNKHWNRREAQINTLVIHTASLYGSLQGIIGSNALPEIPTLSLDYHAEEDDSASRA